LIFEILPKLNKLIQLKGEYVPVPVMEAYVVVQLQLHTFSAAALYGGNWSASRPGRFHTGQDNNEDSLTDEPPVNHCTETTSQSEFTNDDTRSSHVTTQPQSFLAHLR